MRIEHIIKNPSLELKWLPNSIRKATPTPKILIVSNSEASGYYYGPDTYDDLGVVKVGTILIDIITTNYEATLAHEFRHHWQRYNVPGDYICGMPWNHDAPYKENIINYYRTSPHEMDALLFEITHAPNPDNLEQREWILES